MSSFLYIISHPEGWRKVGYAKDPYVRLAQHQRHSGQPLSGEYLFPCEDPKLLEKAAHSRLAPKRVMGEWFNASQQEVLEAVKEATGLDEEVFQATGRPWISLRSIMITGAQLRMARGYLKWSVKQLAEAAEVADSTIKRMEATDGVPPASGVNLEKVQCAIEAQGISFLSENDSATGPGVSFNSQPVNSK